MEHPYKKETRALHTGHAGDAQTGARAVPIYMTTSYLFDDSDHAAALFNLEQPGHIYSRLSNPTVSVLEERIADLDGGAAGIATASGHAALFLAISTIMGQGGHIVASRALYGGSVNLLGRTLPNLGINTTMVDPRDISAFEAAITEDTRLILTESLGNPGLEVADIEALSAVAKKHGLPLMVDATFASPALSQPIKWGANIVLHSATKWLGGHGVALGGILIDGGNFDWMAHKEKYPLLTAPDASYHGVTFAADFAPVGFAIRARAIGLRDFGAAMSPMNAFMILQGVETLSLRMERHVENATALASWLNEHEAVDWITYPGLENHQDYELGQKYFEKGPGSVISFGVKGGVKAAQKFMESLELLSHLANVGDAKSLILHPASTTHRQLTAEQLETTGIRPEMVRVSVGIENLDDIKQDIAQALKKSQK